MCKKSEYIDEVYLCIFLTRFKNYIKYLAEAITNQINDQQKLLVLNS